MHENPILPPTGAGRLLNFCRCPRGRCRPGAKAAPAETAKTKLVLDKGLDGDAILKSYGKPYEIKPMEVPDKDLKVERWIYRRKINESTTQTPVGYTTITPPNATINGTPNNSFTTTTQIPIYKLKRTTIYQVTELLMVENKLELAKQRTEREEAFE